MELHYNVTGSERKNLVGIIGDTLGVKPKYKGMPSAAYEIGDFRVAKDGTLIFEDGTDADEVTEVLKAAGYECVGPEKEAEEEPAEKQISEEKLALTVDMPLEKVAVGNLTKLIEAKGSLIKKALGVDDLGYEIRDNRVVFPWFPEVEPEEAQAYTHFIAALCKMAKDTKRVTAKETAVDNEKYAFRCFLLRLGFIGAEYKTDRKILLKNLTGSSAFKSSQRGGGDTRSAESVKERNQGNREPQGS